MSDSVLESKAISVRHFFGTRTSPPGLAEQIQLGHVVTGYPGFRWVAVLKQIHSTQVAVLNSSLCSGPLKPPEGDALVTNQPETCLVVRTADCVPVLFVENQTKVIGAIHAGWRGALAGVVPLTIQVCIEEFGVRVEHLHVAIGPSIGPCCYEIDTPVIETLRTQYPQWPEVLRQTSIGKGMLDLKKLLRHQLRERDIPDPQIEQLDYCTHCRADLFFSYRREGTVNGTMLSGIILPAA